ncbi:MAG: LemA family protein [Candidatus Taylorbacteria bacterium RIFCSPHIGHO2_01_FULL_45_63]|uniref:LemA family protein n=1 Tax=Candidatus Taylorbacteria bacterium RIFCSPHIGHO2_02_FULL_45_35 TaxID=1802311 RepID=A0A1G2MX74_9BACT|nr:MAG: LemA family protein [Candidatus Taylorbacteria bacterium RIFCSPHIGHO2_01_FULL_45_63]OHA27561.1 MAG: LemA family protein [Candidatus Taylorbacteria bacterium RIFCSPHIGHO2_02_FULL_45_35]OHA34692.1 MAG: LemA family protein [Candidatus Taylorbacteria bacterium RIFCSPLOWO2_01_FULL_45_34b]
MKKTLTIVIILVVLVIGYGFVTYNSLITSNEGIKGQWAQVEAQYQRRFDLIPNLVESVKGVMKQEQAVFNAIAEARTKYAGAQSVDERAKAAGEVESALGRLLVITENYPELKSAENVQTLMAQIEGTENRISVERKRYNDLVQSYNVRVKRFPSSLVARLSGFAEHAYFESVEGSETAPTVQF